MKNHIYNPTLKELIKTIEKQGYIIYIDNNKTMHIYKRGS